MTTVLHLSRTPLNGHPGFLAALQRRAGWLSKVCLLVNRDSGRRPYPSDIKANDKQTLETFAKSVDVLHLHGDMTLNDGLVQRIASLIPSKAVIVQQYYHEQARIRPPSLRRKIQDKREFICYTAKKGAAIDSAKARLPVVIPVWENLLQPVFRARTKPRVVWTPTSQERMLTYQGTKGKGYPETLPILKKLDQQGVITLDVITDLNWRETMTHCQEADIRLDEVVTGGYGMSSLEGAAQGCLVLGGLTDRIGQQLPDWKNCPFRAANLQNLEERIRVLAAMTPQDRVEKQRQTNDWFRIHYTESWMLAAYDRFYNDCVEQHRGLRPVTLDLFEDQPETDDTTEKKIQVDIRPVPKEDMAEPMSKPFKILQISTTHCAGVIWRIHDIINRYTHHECRTITASNQTNGRRFRTDVLLSQSAQVRRLIAEADVVHFHNWVDYEHQSMAPYKMLLRGKAMVLQYHTEPALLQRVYRRDVINREDIKTLVIAQKHVRFYPNSTPVPNMLDVNDPLLVPSNRRWENGPLKVIYTPTDLKTPAGGYKNTCCGKGYQEMMPVLKRLEAEGIIELTFVDGSAKGSPSWEQLMPMKREHDVCIDECVTGGYHLCTIEALCQGLICLNWQDESTLAAVRRITGSDEPMPIQNVKIHEVETTLRRLQKMRPDEIAQLKEKSRLWAEEHWAPQKMVQHFLRAYEQHSDNHIISTFVKQRRALPIYNVPPLIKDSLQQLRNAWTGKQVVVWGNGPSAQQAANQPCWDDKAKHIGTNAAMKLDNRPTFDAYCITDRRFLHTDEKRQIAENAEGVQVYLSVLRSLLPHNVETNYVKAMGADGFCSDLTKGVFHGRSVVWVGIQLAIWAGASEIVLVGCEQNYQNGALRFYKESNGGAASVDHANLPSILRNYQHLMRLLSRKGIRLQTYGNSRLQQAGVPRIAL